MRTDTWRRASQTLPPSMYVSNICLTNLPLKSGAGSEATAAAKLTVARAHVQAQSLPRATLFQKQLSIVERKVT